MTLAATLLSGCYSRVIGNHARLMIAYASPIDSVNFNKPVAPGARLDLVLRSLDDEDAAIARVVSSAPDVLRVVEVHPTHVVLAGRTVGTAQLTFTTPEGVTDTVDMHVARPDALALDHACTDDLFAVYPSNAEIAIPYDLTHAPGVPVIGYGFYPIKVTPRASLTLDKTRRDWGVFHFRSGDARHRVAIRSTLDDGILGLALADRGEVDGMRVESFDLVEGEEGLVFADPTVGGVPMCQSAMQTRGRSKTPEICDATARLDDDGDDTNRNGIVIVKAKKFGICEVVAEFPEANGGRGLQKVARVLVGKMPEVSASVSAPRAPSAPPLWLAPLLALLAPALVLPLLFAGRRQD